ncbi:methylated-DNA--[protein]-cysteine S-methyltransferase [Betaproteobacteria bacterium SCN2]|jgi:methylated-DNA-[protein]-cysteine S-methyltransferase|nr:methylated-DNA--[protein]-cysteine S-methyltransferase [Betaproteobacteria bacterium SCN2]
MEHAVIDAPFGQLRLIADHDILAGIDFLLEPEPAKQPATPVLKETVAQLAAYFKDPHFRFDLPMRLDGTPFQLKVWQALCDIPPGAPLTYGQLAKKLATAPRAVGGACGANPIPVIVPCHRVVSAGGLGGFMGTRYLGPLNIKSWLLAHERQ